MEKFKVGDKVRIRFGALQGQEGVVEYADSVTPYAYSISVQGQRWPLWYGEGELGSLYKPERLADWEIELLLCGTRDQGSIYEKVASSHGLIPLELNDKDW